MRKQPVDAKKAAANVKENGNERRSRREASQQPTRSILRVNLQNSKQEPTLHVVDVRVVYLATRPSRPR
jgi:hypothetical protein